MPIDCSVDQIDEFRYTVSECWNEFESANNALKQAVEIVLANANLTISIGQQSLQKIFNDRSHAQVIQSMNREHYEYYDAQYYKLECKLNSAAEGTDVSSIKRDMEEAAAKMNKINNANATLESIIRSLDVKEGNIRAYVNRSQLALSWLNDAAKTINNNAQSFMSARSHCEEIVTNAESYARKIDENLSKAAGTSPNYSKRIKISGTSCLTSYASSLKEARVRLNDIVQELEVQVHNLCAVMQDNTTAATAEACIEMQRQVKAQTEDFNEMAQCFIKAAEMLSCYENLK